MVKNKMHKLKPGQGRSSEDGFKLEAEFLYDYPTIINGQQVTVKRYSSPRLDISDAEKEHLNKLFNQIKTLTEE